MADTESSHGQSSGHENRDIRVRPVMWTGGILLVVTVASMVLMMWMFDALVRVEDVSQPVPASARAGEAPPAAAGQPRFVMFPARNLKEFRQAESQYLNSYGWVDREQGIARVPVERAMDILVEGGLPPVPPPPPAGESAP